MSLLLGFGGGRGAYARDKNTSARLCTKKAGGGGLAGHYGIISLTKYLPLYDDDFMKQENALLPIYKNHLHKCKLPFTVGISS